MKQRETGPVAQTTIIQIALEQKKLFESKFINSIYSNLYNKKVVVVVYWQGRSHMTDRYWAQIPC